ncbi:MAG TPA: ABC transporter ATP-binding protein [Capsulimonadaceae bacterium]
MPRSTTIDTPINPVTQEPSTPSSDPKREPPEQAAANSRDRLLKYIKPHKRLIGLGIISSLGVAGIQLGLVAILGSVIESMKPDPHGHLRAHLHEMLVISSVGIVVAYLVRGVFSWLQQVYFSEAAQRIAVDLKTSIFRHLQRLSLSYFDKRQTGDLISVISNDVPLISNGVISLKDVISAPIIAIVGLVSIFWLSWELSLATIATLPFIVFALNQVSRGLRAISHETQTRLGELTTTTEETLGGVRLVRSFVSEDREIARFEGQAVQSKNWFMHGVRRSAALMPVSDLVGSVGIAIALIIGGGFVIDGTLTLSRLAMFVVMLDRIRTGVGGMSNIMVTWRNLQGVADRVFTTVLDVPTEVMERDDAYELPHVQGEVVFDHVSFEYIPGRPVLDDISFEMHPGQVLAIVGESGSGKSTLSDLIPRFYDPTSGSVKIDGYDIRDVTLPSLRTQIGIVDQVTNLFGGTVMENIAYGRPDATMAEIEDAARKANAHDFILEMGEGYDTIVGQRGVKLSGGQRQRLAIARAILSDPRILILDEATSSLDTASEQLVQEALDKLMRGRTTLVIAHRLSTVVNAHKILVLDKGRVIESGTHSELLAQGGRYSVLYETQYRTGSTQPEAE